MRHKAMIPIAGGILLAVMLGGVATAATASPFSGRWTSTDVPDGSSQVLLISSGAQPSVVYQDSYASAGCALNFPATHWVSAGRGEVDGDTLWAFFHKSGCGLFTIGGYVDSFEYDAGSDTLTDSAGITWYRNP
jgi:hypothetical protein